MVYHSFESSLPCFLEIDCFFVICVTSFLAVFDLNNSSCLCSLINSALPTKFDLLSMLVYQNVHFNRLYRSFNEIDKHLNT